MSDLNPITIVREEWSVFREHALGQIPRLTTGWLLRAALPAAAFYTVVVFSLIFYGASMLEIITDPEIPEGQAWFRGIMSTLGIAIWLACGAICIFTAWCIRGRESLAQFRPLLIAGGVLTLMLTSDDGLMLHDRLKHQLWFYLTYALLSMFIVLRFFRLLQKMDFMALVLSGGCLAMSIFVDLIQMDIPVAYPTSQFFEEGFKFIGIIGWSYFWMRTCRNLIDGSLES